MPTIPSTDEVRPAAPSLEQEELRGISRTVAEIHWLLLILVLLYVIYGDSEKEAETAVIAASFFYAAFVMFFRYANFYKSESRWKVALETWAMIGFITWVCYFTGGLASPLLNTYLLPVITSALTLGKLTTLVEVALIAACQVFLGGSFSMGKLMSLAFLGGFAAQIAPVILVASIVTMFSADTGNRLLRQITRLVHAELRYTDVPARYGGDEFIVLLPETPPKGALEVAGRIRDAVASVPLELDGKRIACTVSIGIAGHPADGNTLDAVVARADRAMYQAKRQGRNCVVQFDLASVT